MDEILKISAVAVTAALAGLVVKKGGSEFAILLGLAAVAAITALMFTTASGVIAFLKKLSELAGLSPAVLSPLIKTLGIAILAKIASDTCRDAGQSSVASGVELAGTVAAIYVALPLLSSVLEMIITFM
ncbi:stage III sporulation protein AD [Clostridia bacterium]|nr:stage III sporulation protein AD [Clostridia bacterium]